MNQHPIQRDMSKPAYWGTYLVELVDVHFVSSGNNRGSDASTNDARRGQVGRASGNESRSRPEGAWSGRRGSSTAILDGKDGTGIIDHLLGAERLHLVLFQQTHFISNHRNIQRSKVIPIFGCLSRYSMRNDRDELTDITLLRTDCLALRMILGADVAWFVEQPATARNSEHSLQAVVFSLVI